MKFLVTTTAQQAMHVCGVEDTEPTAIEFDDLESFIKWVDEQKHLVIIGRVEDSVHVLELYDDYRE